MATFGNPVSTMPPLDDCGRKSSKNDQNDDCQLENAQRGSCEKQERSLSGDEEKKFYGKNDSRTGRRRRTNSGRRDSSTKNGWHSERRMNEEDVRQSMGEDGWRNDRGRSRNEDAYCSGSSRRSSHRSRKEDTYKRCRHNARSRSRLTDRIFAKEDDDVEKFTLFFTKKFVFSNHYPCERLQIDGMDFSCTEQYYMYTKARTFCDTKVADSIIKSADPKQMKQFGSTVRNFDEQVWTTPAKFAMTLANQKKYEQNSSLRRELFRTVGTTLVECNPNDSRWGIGLSMNDPAAMRRKSWKGQNWLGQILTAIRDELGAKSEYSHELEEIKQELRNHNRRTI